MYSSEPTRNRICRSFEVLARHPSIRMGLHYSGPLLEWIERAHPEYFDRLRALVQSGQVEMVGGGFYEPILIAIPPQDRHEQITRLADYIEKHFGARPRGAWLAERVWEPQIPSSLAPAGVEYTLVDDNHFLGAGFELEQLYGYYIAEDLGHTVKAAARAEDAALSDSFPRSCARRSIFCAPPRTSIPAASRRWATTSKNSACWPGTYEHCYTNGWLDEFFLGARAECWEWLEIATPASAVASHAPLGRADLPTASYTEMMEWSLPTAARKRYHALVEEFAARPEALPFLRGGMWRSFFTKYSESNLLHKKMLHVSRKSAEARGSNRRGARAFARRATRPRRCCCAANATTPTGTAFSAGCIRRTCARRCGARWCRRKRSPTGCSTARHSTQKWQTLDFDADGREEIYFTSDKYAALVAPDDGGTICALDFRPANATLINSLMRRREAYHAKLQNLQRPTIRCSVQSIHEQTRAKEEGLERWLHYDRWPRNCLPAAAVRPREKRTRTARTVQPGGRRGAGRRKLSRVKDVSETRDAASARTARTGLRKRLFRSADREGIRYSCDVILRAARRARRRSTLGSRWW